MEQNKMTDKQFVEMLKNIKEYCEDIRCSQCKFYSPIYTECCNLLRLTKELNTKPTSWGIEEIERIIING